MTFTFDQIVSIIRNRQEANHPLLQAMIGVRDRYNADWVIPFVSEQAGDNHDPMTAFIIGEAVDKNALRAASVKPAFNIPAVDPAKLEGPKSGQFAAYRRRALGAAYKASVMDLAIRRAMRHYFGYATTAMVIVPDERLGHPRVELRDPLGCYPEPKAPGDYTPTRNCGFVFGKSGTALRALYPACRTEVGGIVPPENMQSSDEIYDVVEWIDEDECVLGIIGKRAATRGTVYQTPVSSAGAHQELGRYPNVADGCPVVTPERVTLDRVFSQISAITHMTDLMAKLQALAIAASEKAIFPDRYVMGDGSKAPRLVSGAWKDGRTGEVNLLQDAKMIGNLPGTPDQSVFQQIDRIERNARVSAGLVPSMQGETMGALRTGRGMDAMMAAAVDPTIMEAHVVFQVALEQVNGHLLSMWKNKYAGRKLVLFSGWHGDFTEFEFDPGKHIETTANSVNYAIPGSDVQGLTIQLGQLNGMHAMSLETLRALHPYINSPEMEKSRVEAEALEDAVLQGIAQGVVSGQVPPSYVALIESFRLKGKSLLEAIRLADEEIKEQQAAEIAAAQQAQAEAAGPPPDAMPGLAGPGAPGLAVPPDAMGPMPAAPGELPDNAMPGQLGPSPDMRGLRRLMESLSQSPPTSPASASPTGV